MRGHVRARIDHGHPSARAHDMDAGAPEGERPGIGRQQPRHQGRQPHLHAGRHVQRTVEIHLSLTREKPGSQPYGHLRPDKAIVNGQRHHAAIWQHGNFRCGITRVHDRTVRFLGALGGASTSRVLNLVRIAADNADDPEYAEKPLFLSPIINTQLPPQAPHPLRRDLSVRQSRARWRPRSSFPST